MERKDILLLGSTGSVGRSTLSIIREYPAEFRVRGIVASGRNWESLAQQAKEFQVRWIGITNDDNYTRLKEKVGNIIIAGLENILAKIRSEKYHITVSAIMGLAGLKPTVVAIPSSNILALANKESLICAGDIIHHEAQKSSCTILPLDSEHNAMFQVFEKPNSHLLESIILTASGGPFRKYSPKELKCVTPQQAVAHPNWSMGAKISVDSATLMNKGLELIETCKLFNVNPTQIEVVVHPQSIIHSCVSYADGSVLAQLGMPSMRTPISFALCYPQRMKIRHEKLSLKQLARLDFEEPNYEHFPLLNLAQKTLETGQHAIIALNAANEVAVHAFLAGKIQFLDIHTVVETALNNLSYSNAETIDEIFHHHLEVTKYSDTYIKQNLDT